MTLQTTSPDNRDDALAAVAAKSTVGPERSPVVPDHVPAHVAAEHPDAAHVVAARRPSRGGVRVVARGDEHRSPAATALAMAACALVAAFTAKPSPPADAATTTTPPPSAAVAPTPAAQTPAACPPGTPVVVRCQPPCAPLPPLTLHLACLPAASGR